MDRITSMNICSITMSGFRNCKDPVTYTLGDMTCVTGHNGTGKTSIAHAICFAFYGVNYYGEQKIERLMNDQSNICDVAMDFTDQNGNRHTLQRRRVGNKTDLYYDGYTVKQEMINGMFCDKETFLSVFNPFYLTESGGEKGRELLIQNMKSISPDEVISSMSESFRKSLEGLNITSPADMLAQYRAAIRKCDEQVKIYEAKIQTLRQTETDNRRECDRIEEEAEEVQGEVALLKEKQFEGLDTEDFEVRRNILAEKLKQSPSDSYATKISALKERLENARERVWVSQYSVPLTRLNAEIDMLRNKYSSLKKQTASLQIGQKCPTCHIAATAENIQQIKAETEAQMEKILAEAKGLVDTKNEMLENEKKSQETFEQFKKNDIDKLSQEIDELTRLATDEVTPDLLQKEIEEIDVLLTKGLLTDEDYEHLLQEEKHLTELEAQFKKLREYSATELIAELNTEIQKSIEDSRKYNEIVSALQEYILQRTKIVTDNLKMPNTSIVLFEPVKTTGELKSVFRFSYKGREYSTLSLSEKTLAGLEVTALLRNIIGLDYPVCIDNTESIADFDTSQLASQSILLRMVKGRPLSLQVMNRNVENTPLPMAS